MSIDLLTPLEEIDDYMMSRDPSQIKTEIIEELISYSKKQNLTIALEPNSKDPSYGTTSQSRLVKFYKKFGFIENKTNSRNSDDRFGGTYMIFKNNKKQAAPILLFPSTNAWFLIIKYKSIAAFSSILG